MTSKLTRERLQEIAEDGFLKHGESKELARMALAAMDCEPDCNEQKLFCSTDTARMRKVISASDGTDNTALSSRAASASKRAGVSILVLYNCRK
ncbi:Eaa1 [Klebsiella pneumoniae]|nr:Eaa1 [Klebsiella pneumoniae]